MLVWRLVGLVLLAMACAPPAPPGPPRVGASGLAPLATIDAGLASARPPTAAVPQALASSAGPAVVASEPRPATESAREWTIAWQRQLGFVTQPPRVGNGLLYMFIGNDVAALDARTGEPRWLYRAPRLSDTALTLGCPCASTTADFSGKDIYVLAGANELRALDSRTGEFRWAQQLGQAITTPTVSVEGVVVLGTMESPGFVLYGLDERSGATRWKLALDRRLIPWVVRDGSTVLGATSDQRLVAVDALSGRLLWTTSLPPGPALPPPDRLSRGALAVGADSSVRLFETTTGRERWSARVRDWPGAPLQADGRVFAATISGQVVALDEHDGRRLWRADLTDSAYSGGLAHATGTLYVPTLGGTLAAVDAADGRIRWTRSIGEVQAAPTAAQGTLLIGTIDGDLAILATASGEVLIRFHLGEAVRFSPVAGEGFVYMVAEGREGSILTALQTQAR